MPSGTVATVIAWPDASSAPHLPAMIGKATLTGGAVALPGSGGTARIGQSSNIKPPRGMSGMSLVYKITAAATDAADSTYALVEAMIGGEWIPIMSTATIAGNAAEPYVKGVTNLLTTTAVWAKDNKTAVAASLSDASIPSGIVEALRIAFYVTADTDTPADESFTGYAELWAF